MSEPDLRKVVMWRGMEDGFELPDELWNRQTSGTTYCLQVHNASECGMHEVFGNTESSEYFCPCAWFDSNNLICKAHVLLLGLNHAAQQKNQMLINDAGIISTQVEDSSKFEQLP